MAFTAGTIWENRNDGNANNGAGFDPTATLTADLTTDANTANTSSPIVSSASYNFQTADAGHWLFIQSGTNWTPGWYYIVSVASNKATLTAGVGTAVLYGTSSTGRNYQRPNGVTTAAGCATTGTPTSGVWTIDYTQSATGLSITGIANAADMTHISSVTSTGNAAIGVNWIGNTINITTAGTTFILQRVLITAVAAGVATVDKALAAGSGNTGGAGTLGGAVGTSSTLGALALSVIVAGNQIYVKATGTYTLTTTTTVTASVKGDTTSGRIIVEGYTTYRGQRDGRPLITTATNSVSLITLNDNDFWEFVHLRFTCSAATKVVVIATTTSNTTPLWLTDIVFGDPTDKILNVISGSILSVVYLTGCEVMYCTSASAAIVCPTTVYLYGCDIHDNTGDGVRATSGTTSTINAQDCIFDSNGGIGINDISTNVNTAITIHGCIFVDNTSDGIKSAAKGSNTATWEVENNIFYGNGGYGIDQLDTQIETVANIRINRNNAYGSNNGGGTGLNYTGWVDGRGDVTLTADPFTNRASRDFSPNTTAGGGAAIRSLAFPTTFPAGTTNSYRDIGAVQHQDSGGGTNNPYIIGG